MRRIAMGAVLVLCSFVLVACGKPYVGRSVGYSGEGWCRYTETIDNGVKRCVFPWEHAEFDVRIQQGEAAGEYLFEGTIDLTKGSFKSFNHIRSSKTRFFMLVASEGVIVDYVSFRPIYTDSIGSKLPFSFKYVPENGFGMITFSYHLFVQG